MVGSVGIVIDLVGSVDDGGFVGSVNGDLVGSVDASDLFRSVNDVIDLFKSANVVTDLFRSIDAIDFIDSLEIPPTFIDSLEPPILFPSTDTPGIDTEKGSRNGRSTGVDSGDALAWNSGLRTVPETGTESVVAPRVTTSSHPSPSLLRYFLAAARSRRLAERRHDSSRGP